MSLALRQFTIEWGSPEQVPDGVTGNLDYELRVPITFVTHYGDLALDRIGNVLVTDHFDVNRHFIDRLETIFGLTNWEPDDAPELDAGARVFEHNYFVSYMRR